MKKAKVYNLFQKIRSAMRDIYRFSPMRREAIKAAMAKDLAGNACFICPLCSTKHYQPMAEVDHNPPLREIGGFEGLGDWTFRLFHGPVRVICKLCHKRVTAAQRRKHVA